MLPRLPRHCKLCVFMVLSCARQLSATRAPPGTPCADSVVPSVSEEDHQQRFFMLDEVRFEGSTCFQLLKNLKASTDSLGYMPDGPWASCLEQAVQYEEKNKAWMLDPRFLSRKTTPQGPAGQVVELFAERVVETQIHLEDCLQSIEARQDSPTASGKTGIIFAGAHALQKDLKPERKVVH